MFSKRHFILLLPLLVIAVVLAAVSAIPTAEASSDIEPAPTPLSPEETVLQAWQAAINSGTYKYDTAIEHTQYPAPRLSNSGRQPTTDFLAIAGQINQAQDLLQMTIWQDAGRHPDRGVTVKVENGQTYGRVGDGEWEEMDDVTSLFAPGRDPLGFLATIRNVNANGQDMRQLGDLTLSYDRYTFELDGDAYAIRMERQMRDHLQQFGSLPPGMRFSNADVYRQSVGLGEIWLDSNGLPVRMTLNLDIPAYQDNGRTVSQITTDLSGFDHSQIEAAAAEAEAQATTTFWNTPQQWLTLHQAEIAQNLQYATIITFILLTSYFILLLIARYWHTQNFHALITSVIIFSIIVPPIITAEQTHAFGENLRVHEQERAQEREEAAAQEEALAQLKTSNWDPHTNPLESDIIKAEAAELKHDRRHAVNLLETANDEFVDSTDSDGDGLLDADEELWGSCAYPLNSTEYNNASTCEGIADPTDTDGDSLTDGIEVNDLGSSPLYDDTDQDGITDDLEIGGFEYNGQTWYSDFSEEDSNRDGVIDGAECTVWYTASEDYDPNAICEDTDGDGTPNLFDDDNDGDGVPDDEDLSPNTAVTTNFDFDNPFLFSATNLEADKVFLVDIQFRPTWDSNLNLYNHVLDWPSNDTEGQITRYLDTTWADTANSDIQSDDDNAANGDIRLVPMLEITMPYGDGHYANLPITNTAPSTRVLGESVDSWLDSSQLDPVSVSVEDVYTKTGTLAAYVPIVPITDDYDGTVAYGAQMLYRPSQEANGSVDWGEAHEYRVVWIVQMITDQCIDEDADPDDCEREDVMTIMHTYYEEWELTGLNASEEHGLQSAIVYEDPALDDDLDSDDQLWTLSWNLGNTFMRGRDCEIMNGDTCADNTDGERDVTVANLDTSIDDWLTNGRYLVVDNYNYDHSGYMGYLVAYEAADLLDTTFTSYADDTIPTLMYVHENETRAINLDNGDFNISNSVVLDFDPNDVEKSTTASMSWTPYDYVGGEWTSHDSESYLDILETRLQLDSYFQAEDESDSAEYEAYGKVLWAQMYYTSLMEGASALIEINSETIFTPNVDGPLDEADFDGLLPDGVASGAGNILSVYLITIIKTSFNSTKTATEFLEKLGKNWSKSTAKYTFSFQKQFKSGQYISIKTNVVTGMVLTTAVVGAALLAAGYFSGNDDLYRAGIIMLSVVTIVTQAVYAINGLKAIRAAAYVAAYKGTSIFSAIQKAGRGFPSVGVLGFVLGVLVAWGLFVYQAAQGNLSSFELNALLAYTIASTIVAAVFLFLDLIGFGIVGHILVLIDAILLILGEETASEWITEAIAEFLYDVDMVIKNLESSDRLDLTLADFDLSEIDVGFNVNNDFIFTYDVTNTLKYDDFYFDLDDATKRNVFTYTIQTTSDSDLHTSLQVGDQTNVWRNPDDNKIEISTTLSITIPMSDIGVGLNKTVPLYIVESYLTSYRGCWIYNGLFGIDGCEWGEATGANPIDLSDSLVYDILPTNIQTFVRMEWDSLLLAQVDEDADGLPGTDGTDPNDNDADTDGDGLLDTYEVSYGLNYILADSDNDGLTDAEELDLETNPLDSDTDGDGLNDYVETKEGWLIIYNDSELTRIYSDPNSADFDEDGLDDLDEFLFGFNPWVETDPSIIETLVEFDDLTVEEDTNLQMLFRMEESADAAAFIDSSGQNIDATCDTSAGQCPLSEANGRYGNGLFFDGDDYVATDLALDVTEFTTAAWIYNTADDTGFHAIMGYQNGGTATRAPGMYVYEQTKIHAGFSDGTWSGLSTGDVLTQNQWQHVATTFDGTTYRVYVDGVDVYNTTSLEGKEPVAFSGYNIGLIDNYFEGNIDEAAFFDKALTEDEIGDLMNGRYNANDLYAAAGTSLTYRATITNSTSTNATGFLAAETDYIEPELPDPLLALSFEQEQRLAFFENSVTVDDTPIYCTYADDSCPASGQDGQISNSVAFDGVNDYLIMPGLVGQYEQSFSILFWLYVESIPESGEVAMILDSESTSTGSMDIYLNSDGNLVAQSRGLGSIQTAFDFGSNLNTWVHVGWVRDRFYINYSGNGGELSSEDEPTRISAGRLGNSIDGTSPFHGRIDELVVFNNDVASDEVDNVGDGSYGVEITQALYRFDELIDYTGNIFYNNLSDQQNGECFGTACPEVTEDDEGYSGRAILFDGVNDNFLQRGNKINSDEAEYIFYIKPLSYPAAGEVAYIYDTSEGGSDENYSFNLYMDENGQLTYDGDDINETFDTVVPLNEWSKIRFWYNDGGSTYRAYLSVNDVTDDQFLSICSGTTSTCSGESQFISWGRVGNNNDLNSPFHGYIDEVSIVIAEYDFDPPGNSVGYENLANDLRTASCDDVFLCASVGEGKYGDGVYFDGADDFLNLGSVLDESTTNFTIGLWFNMTEQTYYHRILEQQDGSGDGRVWLAITDTGQLYTFLSNTYIGGGNPAVGEWHYATVTYDGTTLRLYLNGELTNSADVTPIFSDGDVLLGINQNYSLPFDGYMDELIILTEAADEEQIAFLMESTYPALETANDFETYSAGPLSSTEVNGSATIAENLPTSRYQFDLEVEAALELQTQIDFPVIDDNSSELSVYIPFEDTPGSTVFDNLIPAVGFFDVEYDIEGICYDVSCPTAGVRGIIGRAASFDGSDDFLELDLTGDNFDGSDNSLPGFYSASVWVKGKKGTILDSTSSAFTDSGLRIDFGRIYTYDENNGRISTQYETTFDMPIDEWTHIVLTVDSGDNAIVYVNGQQVATGTHKREEESDLWTIGANFGQQNYFEGLIDDLRVYEITLTAAEVLALYEESAPTLRFEFDEDGTATTFADESPNGFVGNPLATTAYNDILDETVTTLSPAPGTDGKIGNTALFDGSGYIEVPNAADSIDFTQDFTIMTWMKTSTGNTGIVAKTDGDTNWESGEKIFYLNSDGTPRFVGFGNSYIIGDTAVTDDVWRHVVVVWDRNESGTDGTGYIYVNGEDATSSSNYAANNADRATDTLKIGAPNHGEADYYFDGQLDELAIYGRALTAAEISGIYLQEYRWYRANSYNEIQVDLDAPVIEYLSDAAYRAEGYIQLSVATRDTHSYINTFDFGVKGPNDADFSWQSAPVCGEAAATGSAWCPYFDTADYSGEGVYEVQFRVVDAVGNETTSDTHTIHVDGQAPTSTTSYSDEALDAAEIGTLEWTLSLSGTVNDPEIVIGIAGSGVISNTLLIGLFDTSGGLIEDGWQAVTLSGNSWAIDYRFSGEKPSGTYALKLSAEDEVGNTATLELGTITLDERAPSAEANDWELPSEVISETTDINGSVVEQPEWGDAIAEYHFETDAADTTFYDSSDSDYHVSCTGVDDCPTADLTGAFGQALTFDGVDDYMAVAGDSPDLSEQSFTVAVWVNHTESGDWRNIIGQKDLGGTTAGWVLRINQNNTASLFAANGSSSWSATSSALTEGEWHHLVGIVDRSADELRLYVDGVLVDTQTGLSGSLSTTTLTIGRWSNFTDDFFSGSMDELYIYERALTETEIYALAQNEVEGVSSVEVLVEEQDLSSSAQDAAFDGAAATWQPATVSNGAWSYTMPSNTEGFYTVQLRTTDNNSNTADEGLIWRGTIDDIAPRITAVGEQIGGSNSAQTEYTFTITDFILNEDRLDQPCDLSELTTLTYNDEALPQNGTAYQVSATCRVDGHEASRDFTACDVFGNCTTQTVNTTVATTGNIRIDTPASGSGFVEYDTVTISGGAYDPTSITSITVYADGVEIATPSFSGNDVSWSADWSSATLGDVLIEAVMVGDSGTVTDSVTISILQDPLDDLFVAVDGTGDGFVTSDPAGISCGSDCDEQYLFGTVVTLTANANTGSTFTGWSGACAGTADCQMTLNDTTNVTATFTLNQYDLTVTRTGNGEGGVTSDPSGLIDCGADCVETLDHGTVVTLTATAGLEAQFAGWSGACSGIVECVVTMDEAKTVSANFALNQYELTAAVSGDGNGGISSTPAGIDCGVDCAESYAYGTAVTLTATADGSSVFTGWQGACSGQNCTVTMDDSKTVTATFAQDSYDLAMTVLGDGNGTIASDPSGISCEADCAETYAYGTQVTLTASYDDSLMALTWGGSCASAVGDSCTVTMNQQHAATATFTLGSFSLGTNLAGNGNGSVVSDPAGIDCDQSGGVCNAAFTASQIITLTAVAGLESTFTGWSGLCSGTDDCLITLSQREEVTATFILNRYDLMVNTTGNGSGTITSILGGIACGLTCTATLNYGTVVTLTTQAGTESQFTGWSGACSGTADCVVTLTETMSATAEFALNEYPLTVETAGNGSGLIASMPSGIGCGSDCAELYPFGTAVTLVATADSGSVFDGWSGACTGLGDCQVTIDQAQSVTATFSLLTHELAVRTTGDGAGTVSSNPDGINCGSVCAADFDHNTLVVLTATPQVGSQFSGWAGDCSGTGSCIVTMDQVQDVTATFGLIPSETVTYTLTVTLTGDGAGSVSSNPVGIDCGEACSADFEENALVTLTAVPTEGSTFAGWSGACSGADICSITMGQAQQVTAEFASIPTHNEYIVFLPLVTR